MKRIILIDHNKDDLQFLKEALGSSDADIQCLSFIYSGEAIDALMAKIVEKPDAIFMNLNMPRKNGIQCLMELRSDQRFNDLPVFLYAPKITADIVQAVEDSGITLSFEKPCTIRDWKLIVRELLNAINSSFKIEALTEDSKISVLYN